MSIRITSLDVAGFKSICKMGEPLQFGNLNVLIGANGSGKTNLLAFLRMIRDGIAGTFSIFVAKNGYASAILHMGEPTDRIKAAIGFDAPEHTAWRYEFTLVPAFGDTLVFANEFILARDKEDGPEMRTGLGTDGSRDPALRELGSGDLGFCGLEVEVLSRITASIGRWRAYHFDNTTEESRVRGACDIQDNRELHSDGRNLASVLFAMQHSDQTGYARMRDTVRLVAPFFNDFDIEPDRHNRSVVHLTWRENANRSLMHAGQLSDGTIRFMCLATVLCQTDLPDLIVVDEPELGLHPFAINVLGGLLRSASTKTQIIVSTQSVTLLDNFEPEDIIVVDRQDNQSVFRRLDSDKLAAWLEDYSIGELWEKNVVGGRP